MAEFFRFLLHRNTFSPLVRPVSVSSCLSPRPSLLTHLPSILPLPRRPVAPFVTPLRSSRHDITWYTPPFQFLRSAPTLLPPVPSLLPSFPRFRVLPSSSPSPPPPLAFPAHFLSTPSRVPSPSAFIFSSLFSVSLLRSPVFLSPSPSFSSSPPSSMFLSVPVSPSLPPGPLFSLPSQLEFSIPQCPGLSHFPSCLSLFTVPWFCSHVNIGVDRCPVQYRTITPIETAYHNITLMFIIPTGELHTSM